MTCHDRAKVLLRWSKLRTRSVWMTYSCGVCWCEVSSQTLWSLITGWWVLWVSTPGVCQSCVMCSRPPAHRPPWWDSCSTTAAGLSSGTLSSATGHLWVRGQNVASWVKNPRVWQCFQCCIHEVIVCPFSGVVAAVASDRCSLYSLMLRVLPALAMGEKHTPTTSKQFLSATLRSGPGRSWPSDLYLNIQSLRYCLLNDAIPSPFRKLGHHCAWSEHHAFSSAPGTTVCRCRTPCWCSECFNRKWHHAGCQGGPELKHQPRDLLWQQRGGSRGHVSLLMCSV